MGKKNRDGRSRGFGFIRFKDLEIQDKVIMTRHMIRDRWCEVKIPDSNEINSVRAGLNSKIYVSRLIESITSEDLKTHFETFGNVKDVYISKPFRSFAFVTFSESRIAQSLYGKYHTIKGQKVQISHAEPKGFSEKS